MADPQYPSDPLTSRPYRNGKNGANGAAAFHEPESEDREISLQEILETLLKGKWIILACFILVMAAVGAYTFRQAPEYEASSTVFVNSQQTSPQLGELLGLETGNRNILNEIEILKSRTIAMQVAEEIVNGRGAAEVGQPLSVLSYDEEERGPLSVLEVAERLRRQYIEVRPVSPQVDLIEVRATSTIPEEAALLANLHAEAYVNYNTTLSRSRMTASREFLEDISQRFDTLLRNTEQSLMQFSQNEGIVAPEAEAQKLLEQIMNLQTQQYQTLFELQAAQAELQGLEDQLERLKPGLARSLASTDDKMIEGLQAQIVERHLKIEERLATNPALRGRESENEEIARWRQEIEQFEIQLAELTNRLLSGAFQDGGLAQQSEAALQRVAQIGQGITEKKIEVGSLQARLDVLDQTLETYQRELDAIPNKSILLARLQRDMKNSEQLYTSFYEKLQESRIAELSELGYVDIVDHAIVPEKPVRPQVAQLLMVGAVLGLVLGIGLAFLRSAVDNKVRKPEDLRKHGFSVLGVIPDMARVIKSDFDGRKEVTVDGHTYSTNLVSLLNPLSSVAESYRRLRTNIQFSQPDRAVQAILVTSAGPGEGKTVTSTNLAVTMAQSGRRTVLIDADLRRSVVHRVLGIPREPGLVNLLFEAHVPDLGLFATAVDNLYAIPAGNPVPNPAEILGSKKIRDLVSRLRREADVIIIDTPPILAVTDALLLAAECDAVVLVGSAGDTNWHALNHARESLRDVGAEPAGVVLNRFDAKTAYGSYGSGYGYGYGYYEYYGDKASSPARV